MPEVRIADALWFPLFQSACPPNKGSTKNPCPRKLSSVAALFRDEFRAGDGKNLISVNRLQSTPEVRSLGGFLRLDRGNDSHRHIAATDFHAFAGRDQCQHCRHVMLQLTDGRRLHLWHNEVTQCACQEDSNGLRNSFRQSMRGQCRAVHLIPLALHGHAK